MIPSYQRIETEAIHLHFNIVCSSLENESEIVEEGLFLKREIQTVQRLLQLHNKNSAQIDDKTTTTMNKMKKTHQLLLPQSVFRAASIKSLSSAEESTKKKASKRQSLQIEPTTEMEGRRRRSKMARICLEEEDKENAFQPLQKNAAYMPLHTKKQKDVAWNGKKYTMKDDTLDQSSRNIRCIPKNFLTPNGLKRKSSSKSSAKVKHRQLSKDLSSPKVCPRISDLKSGSYHQHEQSKVLGEYVEQNLSQASDNVSLGFAGCVGGVMVQLSPKSNSHTPVTSHKTPIDNAANNKTIRDISDISRISNKSSYHEQASSANLSGAFHSTFNYPLHSTFNYPLHSSFNFSVLPKIQEECKSPSREDCSCMSDATLSFDDQTSIDVDKTPEGTLCDSSFLSECADDLTFTDCTMYTPQTPCRRQKTMKRQSGQAKLKQRRDPVGLSESDLLVNDLTQMENVSLSATRATEPSLSDLSDSESPLLSHRKRKRNNSIKESIQIPFCTLIGFEQTASTFTTKPHRTPVQIKRPSRKHRQSSDPTSLPTRPPCIGADASSNTESAYSTSRSPSFSNVPDKFITMRPVSASKNITKDRKRELARRLREFSQSFQNQSSLDGQTGVSQLQTLAHF